MLLCVLLFCGVKHISSSACTDVRKFRATHKCPHVTQTHKIQILFFFLHFIFVSREVAFFVVSGIVYANQPANVIYCVAACVIFHMSIIIFIFFSSIHMSSLCVWTLFPLRHVSVDVIFPFFLFTYLKHIMKAHGAKHVTQAKTNTYSK